MDKRMILIPRREPEPFQVREIKDKRCSTVRSADASVLSRPDVLNALANAKPRTSAPRRVEVRPYDRIESAHDTPDTIRRYAGLPYSADKQRNVTVDGNGQKPHWWRIFG